MVTLAPSALAGLLGDGWRGSANQAAALAAALRALVVDGRLAVRTRVPSERALAPVLGVSRGTVSRAYDRLRTDGYLVSARGAGSWLALPDQGDGRISAPLPQTPDGERRSVIDLSVAALPAPEPLLAEAAQAAARALTRHAPTHGYAATGLPDLREAIAARFTERGAPTTADQVLVTAGAQHALHLLLQLVATPGDRVLVDAPAYPRTLSVLRLARTRPVGVPLTPAGWDADGWEQTLAAAQPRLAVTVADFHNPTGLTMPAADRERLARACARAGTLLVSDETNAELRLDGPAPEPPLAAFERGGGVVTLGSMSKAAWGGLRLGWIRATPRLVRELAAARADLDIASPVLEQLLAIELLRRWDEVLASRRALLAPRRDALLTALTEHAPSWETTRPHGGLSVWARLPAPVATGLAAEAAREHVLVVPGPSFALDGTFEHHLRLPYTLAPETLHAAVRTLARAAGRVGAGASVPHEALAAAAV